MVIFVKPKLRNAPCLDRVEHPAVQASVTKYAVEALVVGVLPGAPRLDEVGYIALQCPEAETYHLQLENLFVEVLNDAGRPCRQGEIGRIVLATLHNFASPLIRYEIQDYVEMGEPCSCGRGLPVVRRVLGRRRNMAMRPDGGLFWPSFPARAWADIADIRQIQLVQKTKEQIDVRYVMANQLFHCRTGYAHRIAPGISRLSV